MPTYGFLLVKYLFFKGTLGSMLLKDSLCFVFLFTAIIPFLSIGILYKFKKISSLTLDKPSDRQLPYLITLLSYIVLVIYFVTPINPFSQYMFVAIVCLMLVMLINIVWKISAHMTAIGGLIAMIMFESYQFSLNPYVVISILFFIAGLVAYARVYLKSHTILQTLVGFLLGFVVLIFMF
jgi:membrane-associated phospholipid phosphatase